MCFFFVLFCKINVCTVHSIQNKTFNMYFVMNAFLNCAILYLSRLIEQAQFKACGRILVTVLEGSSLRVMTGKLDASLRKKPPYFIILKEKK